MAASVIKELVSARGHVVSEYPLVIENSAEDMKKTKEVLDMLAKLGLEKEIKTLFRKYGDLPILSQTIGYQEWLPYMNSSGSFAEIKNSIDSKIKKQIAEEISKLVSDKIKNHTRQYAKRQLVWFKKDSRIIWLPKQDCFKKASKLISRFIL